MVEPMLATPADEVPVGPEWSYEPKWDGYRAVAEKSKDRVRIYSRNLNDFTAQYPSIASAINRLAARACILDGEIVALDTHGLPSFQSLQHRATTQLVIAYYVFDLLSIDGRDLMSLPLDARRVELRHLKLAPPLLLSDALPGTAEAIVQAIRHMKLEGVVAKRRDSIYRPAQRNNDWVKVRFGNRQEFVVGGYRPDGASFDALIVGVYEGKQLLYVSRVRSGFTSTMKRTLLDVLSPLDMDRCPFANLPAAKRGRWGEGLTAEDMTKIQWVKPAVVVDVSFVEWTRGGGLRHPKFVGTRVDKQATQVGAE